ncbi:MAG TPA: MYXO-CTERM sorting domain-containing protein [Minicystis sp.]|nr:MYXO-CTERM sorting domain-containing protein [Minicystis sp.]
MRRGSLAVAGAVAVAVAAIGGEARAYDALATPCSWEPLTCEKAQVTFDKTDALPIEWQVDTGWTPPNSPLEVRIQAGVWAHTRVGLTGNFVTSWPEAMTLEAFGKPVDGGLFGFHYGAEFEAQGKIDVTVAGQTITWQGDLPYIPSFDFEVQDEKLFSAWAYDPGQWLDSTTAPQQIASISLADLLGAQIPGIDGGFELDVAMELKAHYWTTEIDLADAEGNPAEGGPLSKDVEASSMSYKGGPHMDVSVEPKGMVHYDGVVHMIPAFYVSILGADFTIPVADVPVPISLADTTWDFDPQLVRVPVPDLYLDEKVIDFGEVPVGEQREASYHAWNAGEALLHADVATDDSAFDALGAALDLDPNETHAGKVRFSPMQPGPFEAHLTFASNDPSDPVEFIVLKGNARRAGPPSDGSGGGGGSGSDEGGAVDENGGCACRVAGPGGERRDGALAFAAVAALGAIRRRRRPSPSRSSRG